MAMQFPSLSHIYGRAPTIPPLRGPNISASSDVGRNIGKILKKKRNEKKLEEIRDKPFDEWSADDFAFVRKEYPEVIQGEQDVAKRDELQNKEAVLSELYGKPMAQHTRKDRVRFSAYAPEEYKQLVDINKRVADLGPAQRKDASQMFQTAGTLGTVMFMELSQTPDPRIRQQIFERDRQIAVRNDPSGMMARTFEEMAKDLGDFSDAGLKRLESESRSALSIGRSISYGAAGRGSRGAGGGAGPAAGGSPPWGKGGELKWKTKRRAIEIGERNAAAMIDKYGLPYNPAAVVGTGEIDNDTPVVLTRKYGRVTLSEWDEYMQTGRIARREGDLMNEARGGGSQRLGNPSSDINMRLGK